MKWVSMFECGEFWDLQWLTLNETKLALKNRNQSGRYEIRCPDYWSEKKCTISYSSPSSDNAIGFEAINFSGAMEYPLITSILWLFFMTNWNVLC